MPQLFALPPLPNPNWCAATSSTGASVILPLTPKDEGGYVVEFAMFGGHTSRDNSFADPTNTANTLVWGKKARPVTRRDVTRRGGGRDAPVPRPGMT